RSTTSLMQIMGRAARHLAGKVIMYADKTTDSMKSAIEEVDRRRKIQADYNQEHGITPQSIHKPVRKRLIERTEEDEDPKESLLLNDLPASRSTKQDKELVQLL